MGISRAKDNDWRTILCSGSEHLDEKLVQLGFRTGRSNLNYDNSRVFANSDVYTRLSHVIRYSEKRVCILQSFTCSGVLDTFKFTTADRIIEILQVLDILKNPRTVIYKDGVAVDFKKEKQPKKIEVICLHLAFSKQDKIYRTGESNSCKLILDSLYSAGVSRVIIIDPHPPQDLPWMQNYIEQGRLVVLSMYQIIMDKIKSSPGGKDFMFVLTPGKKRTNVALELPNILKQRIATNKVDIRGNVGDEIANKRVFLIDDMVISGTTIINVRKSFLEQGAKEVYCWITHALPFSSGNEDNLMDLVNEFEGKIYVSDTIRTKTFERFFPNCVVSCVPLIVDYLKGNTPQQNIEFDKTRIP